MLFTLLLSVGYCFICAHWIKFDVSTVSKKDKNRVLNFHTYMSVMVFLMAMLVTH